MVEEKLPLKMVSTIEAKRSDRVYHDLITKNNTFNNTDDHESFYCLIKGMIF